MLLISTLDIISDENFDGKNKLKHNYYRLKYGFSLSVGIARLVSFLFENSVPNVHVKRIGEWDIQPDGQKVQNIIFPFQWE